MLNCGSSSVKAAWFRADGELLRAGSAAVAVEAASPGSAGTAPSSAGPGHAPAARDHAAAIDAVLARAAGLAPAAVGHRIVHGGGEFLQPCIIDADSLERFRSLAPLAPVHMPQIVAGIEAARRLWPSIPHVGCFDTSFHRTLPPVARMTALPRQWLERGLRRYGFHGLSYESVIDELRAQEGEAAAAGRIVIAHLGGGASMAAVAGGRSVETTMGFSVLGGLVMGTRCGDVDPGLILYLLNEKLIDVSGLETLLYEQSGLLGVSGVSGDMRELLNRQDVPAVREAIDLYCHSAREHLAALTATLGGLDRVVFTGGVGENAAEIRERICAGLGYLGISVDGERNQRHDRTISPAGSPVVVNVIGADEERVIAQRTMDLVAARPRQPVTPPGSP